MPRGFSSRDGVGFDVADLSKLANDLKSIDKDLRKDLMKRIRQAAEPVRQAVQAEASWSRRIPAAVRIRTSYAARGASVTVFVDAKKAPEARPLNNHDRSGTFRHPVFGNRDNWVAQPARPFLDRGARNAEGSVAREVEKVYDDVKRRAGF